MNTQGKKKERRKNGKKKMREHTDLCVFVWNNICSGTHKSYAQHQFKLTQTSALSELKQDQKP